MTVDPARWEPIHQHLADLDTLLADLATEDPDAHLARWQLGPVAVTAHFGHQRVVTDAARPQQQTLIPEAAG